MSQARRTTFGDDQRLEMLAAMMEDQGHAADALGVRGQMLTVGASRSLYFYDACWRLATVASKDDPARAAAYSQLYALAVPDAGAVFGGELWYAMVPRTARVQHARALYREGKMAEAMAEFQLLAAAAPLDLEVALDAVPELKKLGHEAAAREVFELVFKPLEAFCAKHPEGAFHHNEIAWLAARCDYELEAAQKHALRAVELQPRETNSIDTLAEVYFRRGDRDKAVALMKQCESIEPNQPRHRRRREEFEKGVVGGTGEE
jgi:tetratricopeptide (TPR) repeat protein